MGPSHRIVDFISKLLPLYIHEEVEGVWCARSLVDGTLILPMDEPDDYEEGFVTVHWQGDSSRVTTVQGIFIASYAVTKYVELHTLAERSKDTNSEMIRLAHHFTVKTGKSLSFDIEDNSELFQLISKAVSKVGQASLIELIKKSIGL
jgi:hypothetical protein